MASKPVIKRKDGLQLQRKVKVSGSGPDIDTSAIERAEQALEELSSNFDEWTDNEVERLVAAREAVRQNGCTGEFAEELFRAAHDLKGQAGTFRYPLVMRVSASLCHLLEATADAETPEDLLDIHIDAIRAIVRDRLHGDGTPTAATVADQLSAATEAYVDTHAA